METMKYIFLLLFVPPSLIPAQGLPPPLIKMTLTPIGLEALVPQISGVKRIESPLKLDQTQAQSLTNRYLKRNKI